MRLSIAPHAGSRVEGWGAAVSAAAAAVAQRCAAGAEAYGEALGVGAGAVRWALGQVLSR